MKINAGNYNQLLYDTRTNIPLVRSEANFEDIRKQQKAERAYYQRDELQQCRICGRLFVRRKGDVCSVACAEKATAKAAPTVPSESRS
jgi:hypothetical protein